MKEREYRPSDALIPLFSIAALSLLSINAFSRKSRKEVLEKYNYKCVVCGSTEHLEAAHYPTHKKDDMYDDPSRSLLLCDIHHGSEHIAREGKNGLTKRQNRWSIKQLLKRIRKRHGEEGVYQAYVDADLFDDR